MKAKIFFKNGKSEEFDCTALSTENGGVEVVLKKEMVRPPDKHPIKFAFFFLRTIKKIEIING